jgi:hypothetical protein
LILLRQHILTPTEDVPSLPVSSLAKQLPILPFTTVSCVNHQQVISYHIDFKHINWPHMEGCSGILVRYGERLRRA